MTREEQIEADHNEAVRRMPADVVANNFVWLTAEYYAIRLELLIDRDILNAFPSK